MKKTNENISFAADAAAAFITAIAVLMICSKSSPLYPLNDWVDANTYHTIGRGMLRGRLPYRDLYEQKGPQLYMLHAAAAFVSEDTFLGVFLIEVLAAWAFLTAVCRMLRRSSGNAALLFVPFTGAAIYSADAFCHGDSAEELCLPLTFAAYILGRKAAVEGEPLSRGQKAALGALGGAVLWIKFTFLGVFAAAFLADMIVTFRKKGGMSAVSGTAYCVIGAAAASLPVLLYFGINGAVGDLFSVYFYDNIFRYPSEGDILHHMTDGWNFCRIFFKVPFFIVCGGLLLTAFFGGRARFCYYAGSVLLMSVTVFGGHSSYQYYPLAMAIFLPEAVSIVTELASRRIQMNIPGRIAAAGAALSIAAGCAVCYGFSRNVYLMKYEKDELPQYRFADIISQHGSGSVLNYGFIDGGFYLAAGQVPEFRYFCMNNMDIPEMRAAQEHYVRSGMPDFIVARSESPQPPEEIYGYKLIDSAEFPYYDLKLYYFLYEADIQ